MRRNVKFASSLLAIAASTTLAACGTTVPANRQGLTGQGSLNTSQPGGLGTTTAAGNPNANVSGAQAGTSGVTGAQGGTAGSAAGTSAVSTAGGAPDNVTGTGGTPAPVELGLTYTANGDAFLKALGISGSIADARIYGKALLDYVNKHGGFAGHQVKPVYYNMDLTRTDPYAVWMQEMCASWTQDHHVLAAIVAANSDFSPVAACLAKTHAAFDNPGAWVRTRNDYRKYPNWFEPLILSAERLALEYVDVPRQLGYFGPKPKIGLLVYDYPQSGQMASMVTAELRRNGYDAPTIETMHMAQSTAELSDTLSQVQSAVLKFRAAGVDHVMSVAYPGAITFFMEYAQSQDYYPRYALVSYEGLTAVAGNAPASELKDAVAVGWLPDGDVDVSRRPPINATGNLCRKIFTAAGVAATDQPGGISYCDFVLMLKSAADTLSAAGLTAPALSDAVASLASRFQSPATFGTTLSAAQHDGVDAVRGVRFDSACSCFTYAGAVEKVR